MLLMMMLLMMMMNADDDDNDDDFRYLEQRRIDALKRIEVSKQRKTLYDLIASDKITAIFNARANNNAGDLALKMVVMMTMVAVVMVMIGYVILLIAVLFIH
jgi:hypothetical protein